MYAIAFDMVITDLKENYANTYNNAYFEIRSILRKFEFYNTQGSVYLTQNNNMANLYRAIESLKRIDWFKKSVRDIRVFRVEDWSDFTVVVKENK
jgi:virulence-associated protein VapD